MRPRRHYALAFLLVLLAAVAGAWLGLRLVQPVEVPRLDLVASLQEAVAGVDINALIPRRSPSGGSVAAEAPTGSAEPSPSADAGLVIETPAPSEVLTSTGAAPAEATLPPEIPVAENVATAVLGTPSPVPTPSPPPANVAFAFVPAGPVRHATDDCPGASIRGAVRDTAGNPLPGIRLWRYDQYGNEQTVETKSGPADAGQYDFVLGDTPNVHYVQVVDLGGSPISPQLEVLHRQGDAADAVCHWIDWIRQ